MQALLTKLQQQYPSLRYRTGGQFCWSPESREVFYKTGATGERAEWSLLHETGHALLNHQTYGADYELLRMEISAWQRARGIAERLAITISEDHIEDCLDTYRDWLYKRSLCPQCGTQSLQSDDYRHYRCFNCHMQWSVSQNRFGRAYRSRKKVKPASAILFRHSI